MVSTVTTPTTLLEAVNLLLLAIRVEKVMSLASAESKQDAADALLAINAASRAIQLKGWEFNTEYDFVIDPTPEGEIVLPENCVYVRKARCKEGNRLVERNRKLYDNRKHTFNIGEAVTTELVLCLPFEELSEAWRNYVMAQAGLTFCTSKLPSGAVFQWTSSYLDDARQQAIDEDTAVHDNDLEGSSPHFARMRRR